MVSVHARMVNDSNVIIRSLWLVSLVGREVSKLFQDAFHAGWLLLFFFLMSTCHEFKCKN